MSDALWEAQHALEKAQAKVDALKSVQCARAVIFARLASLPSFTKREMHCRDEVTQWWFGEDLYVELRVGCMEYTVTWGKEGYDLNDIREDWPQQSTTFKHSELDEATTCLLDTFKKVQADAQQIAEARAEAQRKYEEERPAREQRKKEKEAEEKRLNAVCAAYMQRLRTDEQFRREFEDIWRRK